MKEARGPGPIEPYKHSFREGGELRNRDPRINYVLDNPEAATHDDLELIKKELDALHGLFSYQDEVSWGTHDASHPHDANAERELKILTPIYERLLLSQDPVKSEKTIKKLLVTLASKLKRKKI